MTVRTKAGSFSLNKEEIQHTAQDQVLGKHSGVGMGALLGVEEPEDASLGK